jgi:hypothetical protein
MDPLTQLQNKTADIIGMCLKARIAGQGRSCFLVRLSLGAAFMFLLFVFVGCTCPCCSSRSLTHRKC